MTTSSEERPLTRAGLDRDDDVAARLDELGLSMSPDLGRALSIAMDAQAHRVYTVGEERGDSLLLATQQRATRVTRTTALIGAMTADDRVRKAGYGAGLDWEALIRDAGLDAWSPVPDAPPAPDAPLHERALRAIDVYAKAFGEERPLIDPVGLSWALVTAEPGRFHDRLRKAGADPDELASTLRSELERARPSSERSAIVAETAGEGREAPRPGPGPRAGSDTSWAQRVLARLGFDPGPADGRFGPRTQSAVAAFQTDEDLDADGFIGPLTTRALGLRSATASVEALRPGLLGVTFVDGRATAVVVPTDGQPAILDLDTGDTRTIGRPASGTATAVCLAHGALEPLVVTAWTDGSIVVTDLAGVESVQRFELPTNDVEHVAAAQGDDQVAVVAIASDPAAKADAGATWLIGTDVDPHASEASIDPFVYRQDGRWMRASIDPSTDRLTWVDAADGEVLATGGIASSVRLGGPAEQPTLVARGDNGGITRHRALDRELVGPIRPDGADTALYAVGGSTLAIATTDGRVRRFDLVSGREIGGAIAVPTDRVISLGVADSAERTVVAAIDAGGVLWTWNDPSRATTAGERGSATGAATDTATDSSSASTADVVPTDEVGGVGVSPERLTELPDAFEPAVRAALGFAAGLAEAVGERIAPHHLFLGLMVATIDNEREPLDRSVPEQALQADLSAPRAILQRLVADRPNVEPWDLLGLAEQFGVSEPPTRLDLDTAELAARLDDSAIDVMRSAGDHARHISDTDRISSRHLLAALLGPGPSSDYFGEYLGRAFGVGLYDLQLGLYNDIAALGFGDDDAREWRIRLGLASDAADDGAMLTHRPRAGYAGDYVPLGVTDREARELEDRLGIDADVEALSRVAMAVDVDPPMSIGLFGDWGTGKTHFMRLMEQEVRRLQTVAQLAHRDHRPTAYCGAVAQIHFNAWHFVDTNLWASIVTHIFGKLAEHFDPSGAQPDAWDEVLRRTTRAGAELQAASDVVQAVEDRVDTALDQTRALESQIASIDGQIRDRADRPPRWRDFLEVALADDQLRGRLADAAAEVGLDDDTTCVDDLDAQVERATSLPGRVRAVWRKLGGPDARLRTKFGWTMLAVAIVLVPVLGVLLFSTELGGAARMIVATAAALVGGLVNRTVTLRSAIDEASSALSRLEAAHDAVVAQATLDLRTEQDRLLVARDHAQRRLEGARQELERARAEQREAQQLVARVRSGAFIGDFIRERSERPDYKSQLGIINDIRRDFDGLSRLLATTAGDDDGQVKRLDRIILYIDDLDRCPTERVVEVLQAIHLLLTFRLFVVVVGVDSRWLMHALEEQYSAFGAVGGPSTIERLRWRTTPQNYLEKIFQIPFTLRPMGSFGYRQLLDDLTADDRAERSTEHDRAPGPTAVRGGHDIPASPTPGPDAGVEHDRPAEATSSDTDRRAVPDTVIGETAETEVTTDRPEPVAGTAPDAGGASESTNDARDTTPSEEAPPQAARSDEVEESPEEAPAPVGGPPAGPTATGPVGLPADVDIADVDAAPPELAITEHERRSMACLDELVPTPRATKRFVNLYRLIKATIRTDAQLERFVGTADRPGDHQAVMLMLAMQTGFPTQSYEIFRFLGTRPTGRWWKLVDGLLPEEEMGTTGGVPVGWRIPSLQLHGLSEGEAEIWRELHTALDAQRAEVRMLDTLEPFVEYVADVARFGFITGRAVAPERAELLHGATLDTLAKSDDLVT